MNQLTAQPHYDSNATLWKVPKIDRQKLEQLSGQFHFPEFILSILINRGIDTPEKIMEYTKPSILGLTSPFYFRDMEKAVVRLEKAVQGHEGILIFGDRDVDGVTATAILYRFFEKLGANIAYRVPEGTENYGISKEVIRWAALNEFAVIITVDCGITSLAEVEYAASMGIDVIITDHHEPREILPKAYAILNPKVKVDHYAFMYLCGSAVAFKLVSAYTEKMALPEYFQEETIFFDIETTGLNPVHDEIIEIGAVKVRCGVKLGEMQILIRPKAPVSAEITKLTGITQEMLDREGIEGEKALRAFVDFCGQARLVGHNIIDFDLKFVNAALKRCGLNPMQNPTEDTLKMSRVMLKKISDHKLGTVGQALGVYVDTATLHRSLADSMLCAEIYRRLLIQRTNRLMEVYYEYLPLASIGSIADIMPLVQENRTIVKNGLKLIPHSAIGLIYLIRAVELNIEGIKSKEISWNISPLLNSPGRVGDASFSVELLISNKIKETEELVKEIIEKDNTRKGIVDDGVGVVNNLIDVDTVTRDKIIFIASKDFTRGTTGLLANRLCMQFHLPAVILSIDQARASGSIRGIPGLDVVKMLGSMEHLFVQFGGHKAAGGFVIDASQLDAFQSSLVAYMAHINLDELRDEISVDAVLENFDELNLSMIRYLENILEPIGNHNEAPKLLIRGVKIASSRTIGKTGDHTLLTIQKNGKEMGVVGWNWAAKFKQIVEGATPQTTYDIIGSPEINKYQGNEEARLNLIDLQKSGVK